ncbi:probable O-methyltransferase 3 [Ricinus communis]|uniref:O-methyltransferase, putative n=1 Tax=Ricinus communis TaxID=3988 RepID=B9S932_RICCO|nr:probable O-methyltransferase 3 [Ricinus communis]EEF39801.1 o-methyltransferase, putative [Ricinus communis]|eukprot:XP_002522501.1 probable O-methyltransferase 3 [Ricinus communis]
MDSTDSQKATELLQAQLHVYNHIFNYINSMCLKCAVQLGIPDIIHKHGKPITLPELVSALHIHPTKINFMYRLMRMLVHSGFFSITKAANGQEEGQEVYVLTPSSKLLVKDNPNCLKPFVDSLLKPDFVTPGHVLGDWFRGNELTVFQRAHGMAFWEYNERNPEFNQLFNEAMASDSRMMNLVIRDCKPIFEGVNSLVDVGGGNGSLARIISEAFPDMKCTVLELPQVIGNLEGTKNLNYVGGDMFQHIPSADAIILKLILHGWNDEECVKILKKCKEAISSTGKGSEKVIVIDLVINDKKDEYEFTETKLLFDMLMMFVATGKERTEKEWGELFLKAGFSHFKITPILGLRSLIEVYP